MRTADRLRTGTLALLATVATLSPALADDRLRGIEISAPAGFATYSVSIPAIDQIGSHLPADRLESIIRSGELADLAKVNADRISIPMIAVNIRSMREVAVGPDGTARLTFSKVEFHDVRDGHAAAMTIGALAIETPWGRWALENLSAQKADVSATLTRYGMTPATRSGTVIEGIAFDVLHPGQGDRRTKVNILNLEATLAQFRNGIPTSFDVEGVGLDFDIASLESSILAALHAAGLTRFTGTFRIAAEWNESQESISLVEISLSDRTLGGLFLTGEIAGAGKALFSMAPYEASAAAADLAVRFLTLSIIDSGLGNRLAAHFVKSDSADVAEQRAILARKAAQAVFDILHQSDDAGAVGGVVKRFVAEGSKGIVVTAQAKTPPGISITELLSVGADIPALLQRVRIDSEER